MKPKEKKMTVKDLEIKLQLMSVRMLALERSINELDEEMDYVVDTLKNIPGLTLSEDFEGI